MEKKTRILNLKSHAKINLFLDVIGKRKDNFHQIRTIFSEIDLSDKLSFFLTEKTDIKILASTDFLETKENLIYKVAFFIKNKYKVKKGVEIYLEKNIPISAGLGGGSSNAATTIMALSELWELDLSDDEKNEISKKFGSDINFFLVGGTALGEGRGEEITPLKDIFMENIFLVNPGFPVSSREAYELAEISNYENNNWKLFLETFDVTYCYNSLQQGIMQKFPEIKEIIDYLENHGATKAMLSGSGATVIGFFPDFVTAQKSADYYSKKNYWNYITKTKRRTR